MDTQNVSAQLYFKQLPASASETSVNFNVETDAQIETAFQEQLNLSEIYKSPEIFNQIKEKFMNETNLDESTSIKFEQSQVPSPPQVPVKIPVGPEDFLRRFIKEGFGKTSGLKIVMFIILFILAMGISFCVFS